MNFIKAIFLLLAVSTQFVCQAVAQTSRPDQVAAAYLQARQNGDWKSAVNYIHPDHVARLYPYSLALFKNEGNKENSFRKFFVGFDVTNDDLLSKPQSVLVGDFLALLNLMRSGRSGLTEFLGFEIVNSFAEAPDLTNVVVRERARCMGEEYKTVSVLRLKRTVDSWFVLIDEEVFHAEVSALRLQRLKQLSSYRVISLDLRNMTGDQKSAAFKSALRRLMLENDIKYEFIIGKDTALASDLRQIAVTLNVHYRTEFVETPRQ